LGSDDAGFAVDGFELRVGGDFQLRRETRRPAG
jgi:hypothetical protein